MTFWRLHLQRESVCSVFMVEKKPDPDNPQDSSQPCTNWNPVNWFVYVTYFTLPGPQESLPYLGSDYYACKVDLKAAYLHMPLFFRDAAWLVLDWTDGKQRCLKLLRFIGQQNALLVRRQACLHQKTFLFGGL